MAHSAVTPVQQGESASVAAEVPRVEIAVDERVLQAAGNHFGKPPRKIAHKRSECRAVIHVELIGGPLQRVRNPHAEAFGTPVRQPQRERLLHTSAPRPLDLDEHRHHLQE